MKTALPWILLTLALVYIGWLCTHEPAATKTDNSKDSLMAVIKSDNVARYNEKIASEYIIDSLEHAQAVKKFNEAKARTQFEGTGGAIVKENTGYKAAKVVHDTITQLTNCDSMSANVDQAHAEYIEMQRQRDSVGAENEYLQFKLKARIDTLNTNVKTDSLQKYKLSDLYEIKKKEKKPGWWHWVIDIGLAVLLFLKK